MFCQQLKQIILKICTGYIDKRNQTITSEFQNYLTDLMGTRLLLRYFIIFSPQWDKILQHIFLAMSYVYFNSIAFKSLFQKTKKTQKTPKKTKIPLAFLSASLIELCYSIMKQWFIYPTFIILCLESFLNPNWLITEQVLITPQRLWEPRLFTLCTVQPENRLPLVLPDLLLI